MKKWVYIAFLIWIYNPSFSQILISDLSVLTDSSKQEFQMNPKWHASVKPYIVADNQSVYSAKWTWGQQKENYSFRVYPLTEMTVGYDQLNQEIYRVGTGVGVDFGTKKWFITAKGLGFYSKSDFMTDSIQSQFGFYPSSSFNLKGSWFQNSELMAAYKVNRFFTLMGGYGKHFFGNGYRSLLLSDQAAAYPFFKIETTFNRIKYVNLYQVLTDKYDAYLSSTKMNATHYLSWNISKRFNLSLFESVIWQVKDSLTQRYFDPNYINPIVFYRPVEYANGSSDNVILGLNISYTFNKHLLFYGQMVLDEFILSEFKSGNGWWGNKYGLQAGIKTNQLGMKGLTTITEFNMVRPYTYSHQNSLTSYTHFNQSLAHPLGANFYEFIQIIEYKKNKHQFWLESVYYATGIDTNEVNYGQNPLISYNLRPSDYDQQILQGKKINVWLNRLVYQYALIPKLNVYLTAEISVRKSFSTNFKQTQTYGLIGIKSQIWNRYTDF